MESSVDIDKMSPEEKTTYTWKIDDFSSLDGYHVSDDFLQRKGLVFDLVLNVNNAHQYYMPNHCSIYLGLYTPDTADEFNIYCQLSLLNQKGEKCNTKEGFVKMVNKVIESNWHYTISCDYLKSNGLLVDDQLKIYCEVHVLDSPMKPSAKPLGVLESKHSNILYDLVNLFEDKKHTDLILVVAGGKQQFSAHKSILSARSPVFAAMFEHECEESKQNRVLITDVDANTLEELLRYIYTDKCSSADQYSADLMVAADKYQVDSLKAICCESLSTNLTLDSAVTLFVLADIHSADKLKVNCGRYITSHSTELSLEQWKTLVAFPELSFCLFQTVANKK